MNSLNDFIKHPGPKIKFLSPGREIISELARNCFSSKRIFHNMTLIDTFVLIEGELKGIDVFGSNTLTLQVNGSKVKLTYEGKPLTILNQGHELEVLACIKSDKVYDNLIYDKHNKRYF